VWRGVLHHILVKHNAISSMRVDQTMFDMDSTCFYQIYSNFWICTRKILEPGTSLILWIYLVKKSATHVDHCLVYWHTSDRFGLNAGMVVQTFFWFYRDLFLQTLRLVHGGLCENKTKHKTTALWVVMPLWTGITTSESLTVQELSYVRLAGNSESFPPIALLLDRPAGYLDRSPRTIQNWTWKANDVRKLDSMGVVLYVLIGVFGGGFCTISQWGIWAHPSRSNSTSESLTVQELSYIPPQGCVERGFTPYPR